jgi:hypothetical protein
VFQQLGKVPSPTFDRRIVLRVMSAEANRKMRDFVALFQETWAECEAFRTKQKIETSGQTANWEECLKAARVHAQESFEPLFLAISKNAPLIPLLDRVRKRLEASRRCQDQRPPSVVKPSKGETRKLH